MTQKAHEAGADQRTPSIPQYFSWINSTYEGSTETQTLINLDFFAWLKKEFGMEIKIYAWDVGNFDGSRCRYGDADGEKFHRQYPNGYAPVANRAAEIGIRMGLWAGPDGFGDTPEEEKRRYDFMVDLCRKYNFALFKIDAVCGLLRPEKAEIYAAMLRECRQYSPDLVVLNHRLKLHGAEKYVTTSLWQGAETYVDVHSSNKETCMHHRGFIFKRGLPDGLNRLLEDHGVCISSSVAYFEDDLIYQAFGRCMIIAPEIYGNPWLMRDDEYPKLARIYNLHRACAPILVDGMVLSPSYGENAVSRGSEHHRFIATGNDGWRTRNITISLNDEIGLSECEEQIALIQRHPSEKLLGIYKYGENVEVELMPFRSHLFEACAISEALPVLENCEYEVIHEDSNGCPTDIKMLWCNGGEVQLLANGTRRSYGHYEKVDVRKSTPQHLGTLNPENLPDGRSEELYEAAQFAVDSDSLEKRELNRAGETSIPEVKAARDAFFSQATYLARGCESGAMFDGSADTFFDTQSRFMTEKENLGIRICGGCLRVDFGDIYDADEVEIVCFAIHEPIHEIAEQIFTETGSFSTDLANWHVTAPVQTEVLNPCFDAPMLKYVINYIENVPGDLVRVSYKLDASPIRYFRLPCPMDRIYSLKLLKNGQEITLVAPRANNLQAPYREKTPIAMHSATVTLGQVADGDYIAVALNGVHGDEGAYCVAEIDGQLVGFPDRAPAYVSNVWEYRVRHTDRNYTYYLPLDASMSGKSVKVMALLCNEECTDLCCDVWLCAGH